MSATRSASRRLSSSATIQISASSTSEVLSRKGLRENYSHVVSATTIKEQVDGGWLSLRCACSSRTKSTMMTRRGHERWSHQKEATERGIKITGDIVSEWVKKTHEIFGGPRKTIVFCSGVAHGEDLQQKFAEAGYNFVSISTGMMNSEGCDR